MLAFGTEWRELDSREADGISVFLLWRKGFENEDLFLVAVDDARTETSFNLNPETFEQARHCYYHPFASANSILKSGKIAA